MINGLRIILGPVGIWKRPGRNLKPTDEEVLAQDELADRAGSVLDWPADSGLRMMLTLYERRRQKWEIQIKPEQALSLTLHDRGHHKLEQP